MRMHRHGPIIGVAVQVADIAPRFVKAHTGVDERDFREGVVDGAMSFDLASPCTRMATRVPREGALVQ